MLRYDCKGAQVRPAAIRADVGGGASTTDDMAVLGAWKTIIGGLHLHTRKHIFQPRARVAFQSALTRMQQPGANQDAAAAGGGGRRQEAAAAAGRGTEKKLARGISTGNVQ